MDYSPRAYLKDRRLVSRDRGFSEGPTLQDRIELLREYGYSNLNVKKRDVRPGERPSMPFEDVRPERVYCAYRRTVGQAGKKLAEFKRLMHDQGLDAALDDLEGLEAAVRNGHPALVAHYDSLFAKKTAELASAHILRLIYEQLKQPTARTAAAPAVH